MHITIKGIQEPFKRSVEVLIQLFYEDAILTYDEQDEQNKQVEQIKVGKIQNDPVVLSQDKQAIEEQQEADQLTISCAFREEVAEEQEHQVYILVELSFTSEGTDRQAYQSEYHHTFSLAVGAGEEKNRNRAYKFVLNRALLAVLEQFTGIKQPWGVLTGIRPTKLLHHKLQQGTPPLQAQEELISTYRLAPEKAQLMQKIVDVQMKAVPDLHELQQEISIYIGIPFCPTKCAYCTFPAYDIKGQQGSVGAFLVGLHEEIEELGNWLQERNMGITTIYFGGGTPTSIEAEQMDALYEQMYRCLPGMDRVREVTVEAGRPDTITPEKIRVLQKHHIDRISINPQSYTQETLDAIGRHHTVEETIEKYELARSMGLSNINMDLIIGLPGEGVAELKDSLAKTEQLKPESITVHTLSFKRASTMTKNKAKYRVAGREEITEMMRLAAEWTEQQGYAPYYLYRQKNILGNLENVGYALPQKESIYNIIIMEEKQTIVGLGCGASSKFIHPVTGKIERFANPKEPRAYNQNYRQYMEEKLKILTELYS